MLTSLSPGAPLLRRRRSALLGVLLALSLAPVAACGGADGADASRAAPSGSGGGASAASGASASKAPPHVAKPLSGGADVLSVLPDAKAVPEYWKQEREPFTDGPFAARTTWTEPGGLWYFVRVRAGKSTVAAKALFAEARAEGRGRALSVDKVGDERHGVENGGAKVLNARAGTVFVQVIGSSLRGQGTLDELLELVVDRAYQAQAGERPGASMRIVLP